MAGIVLFWAGVERRFHLSLGRVLDLEEACGKVGIGAIYTRIASHQYFAKDIYNTILQGLIGGGTAFKDAKALLDERFSLVPMVESVEVAVEILMSLMSGVAETDAPPDRSPEKPLDAGAILHSFLQAGIPPESVRAMSYADFVNILNAAHSGGVKAPSEDEFFDMVARLVKD